MDEPNYEAVQERARSEIKEAINRRFDQLNGTVVETTTEGLKFLTVIHLAGMGGTLSFMGATKSSNLCVVLAFCSFFVGAFFVGSSYFFRYFHFLKLVKGYIRDVDVMYSDPTMTYGKVVLRDKQRTYVKIDLALACAIFALALFVVGGTLGLFGVLAHVK